MNKINVKILVNNQIVAKNCHIYGCVRRLATSSATVPTEAKVVIYGSDLTTASIAYHLSEHKNYGNNCVVIRGHKPINGPLIDSCPLSHLIVPNPRVAQLIQYSQHVFEINTCGALYLARNQRTVDSFRRRISSAKLVFSEESDSNDLLTKEELRKRFPHLDAESVLGAIHVPKDGVIEDLTRQQRRLEAMAASNGVQFFDGLLLNKININNDKVSNVELIDSSDGRVRRIDCHHFVNACNDFFTRLIAKRSPTRVRIPTLCVHNHVLSTGPHDAVVVPVVHDFDQWFTLYQTTDRSFHLTGYERVSKIVQKKTNESHKSGAMSEEMPELTASWHHFYPILSRILSAVPALTNAKLRRLVAIPENFTPDGRPLIGEVSEIGNYWLAAAVSPQLSAGAGRLISDAVTESEHFFGHDFWSLDARRFIPSQSNRIYLFDRLREVPPKARYVMNFPYHHCDYETGHGLRTSPLHQRLCDAGAIFTQIMGYERPAVYVGGGKGALTDPNTTPHLINASFGRPHWLEAVHREYEACREGVALLDYCSFTKLDIRSNNDEVVRLLQYLCSNDVDVNVGSIVHTGMHNERGGYENDVSLIRLADNHYMLIGPSEQQTRCLSWLRRHSTPAVDIRDISNQWAGLCVMGPLSKLVLQEALADPSALNTFPFFTVKTLAIGLAPEVRVCNLTHTGELGWVLYVPYEHVLHVYDLLVRVGRRYGLRHAGSIAMRTLRIEKFFAFWGQDLDTTTTPFECGRSFRVRFDKDFIGRSALLRQKEEGVRRRYVQLLLDGFDGEKESIWPGGGEPIFMAGQDGSGGRAPVGLTTTTGYGFTLCRHICLGFIRRPDHQMVSNEFILRSRFEVEVGGRRFSARTNIHSPQLTDVSGSYLATR